MTLLFELPFVPSFQFEFRCDFSPSFSLRINSFSVQLKVLDSGDRLRTKRRRVSYFHSQDWERLFPWASTSYSKIAATLFSRDHLVDEV